jgi:bifunctional DNA-binding transcriptional regulator/antitoxin component of YhaV-PrlF toxin-antitoxin module
MAMARRMKISKGGQLSVPAAIRGRWQTNTVVIDDRGDHLVVRPVADDPVEATFGIFADEFADAPAADQMIRELRDEDIAASDRRYRS